MKETVAKTSGKKHPYKKSVTTRQSVYRAAMKLMAEKGYQGATIRDICKHANVSIGTFYSYFKTKSDIIRELYQTADTYFSNELNKEIADKDCIEKLRIYIQQYAKLNMDTGIDAMKVIYNPFNEWFSRNRPMQQVLEQIIRECHENGTLSKALSPKKTVEYLFCVLRGVCYNWCLYNGSYNLEERMLEYFNIMLIGLK